MVDLEPQDDLINEVQMESDTQVLTEASASVATAYSQTEEICEEVYLINLF